MGVRGALRRIVRSAVGERTLGHDPLHRRGRDASTGAVAMTLHVAALRDRLRALGARPLHEDRVLRRWARGEAQAGGKRRPEDFLPLALRHALPALEAELDGLATLRADEPSTDGSRRLLVGLADGRSVEAVLLPRGGLCVSSQVGCAVGCVFCMTGIGGLERQLGSAEIVAQVVLARRLRAVSKVVFMGMGEPAHNLDAVLEAIDLLGTGGGIGHKQLVVSTVGDRRVFERLPAGRVKPALALSLHSTDPALRARLLPRAPAISPEELVALGDAYARSTGYPMQVQWTLLDGVNDGADEIERLVRLLAGRHAVLNLIPYNAVDGMPWARPAVERSRAMARELHRRGILTKLRQSAGQDVQAGCGQLRARDARGATRRIEIVAA
jgi:23S rRNA (adenine2503-C2)-methyltransferase